MLFNQYHADTDLMPYPTFTAEDFCKDPDFIGWVTAPTPESDRFWQTFVRENPHKAADIRQASDFIKTIHFQEITPSQQELARLKQRIWNDIDHVGRPVQAPERRLDSSQQSGRDHPAERRPGRIIQWYRQPYWAAAAVLLLISSVGLGWWYQTTAKLTYATAYGQLQEIRLADGSVVTLNANSSLRVGNHLADSPLREVWLTGEAYFDIAKRQGAKFIVHTPEANVEVLGTEFNVNTRRAQTNVVLHKGKVQLTAANQPAVVMTPGDLATVTPKSPQIQLKRVQPTRYDAWKESYILLDGKPLSDIVTELEDTFGVTVNLENARFADTRLTGKLRTKVADDCIDNLAIILDADVEKEGNTYRFR